MWQDHHGNVVKQVFSENRLYSVEIRSRLADMPEETHVPEGALELLVFNHQGTTAKLHWRKAVSLPSREGDIPLHGFRSRAHLTNDGRTVVVWVEILADRPVLFVISQDREVSLDTSDLLAVLPPSASERSQFHWLVSHESLDLLSEFRGSALYAMWLRPLKQWVVMPLGEPVFRIPSPDEAEDLHLLMLRHCREMVGMYEARKAAKEKPRDAIYFSDIANAYRFLAMNGDPADKPAAERLLATPFKSGFRMCPPFGLTESGPTLDFASYDRALGEKLLADWPKPGGAKESNAEVSREMFFSGLAGVIHFPFALPNPPGTLILTIRPVTEGHDESDSTPITVEFALPETPPHPMPFRKESRPDRLRFRVRTLAPGVYRLKAVWERRSRMSAPPWVERAATPDSKGGAYESVESEKFAIRSGEIIEGIRIQCIQRASADPTLYANDRLASDSVRLGEIFKTESPDPFLSQINILSSVFAESALIRQQQSEAKIILRELRLEQFPSFERKGGKQLTVTFIHLGLKMRRLRFVAELRDDDGQCYEGAESGFGEVREICFSIVPLKSKVFTITVFTFDEDLPDYDPNDRSKAHRDIFELRNLLTVSENELTPESLPAVKVLDLLAAELSELKPSPWAKPGSRSVDPVFRFFDEDGRDAPAWNLCSVLFQDSLGNVASSPDELPASEEVLKLHARFTRDVRSGHFSNEEQWQLQIPRMPHPREFLDFRRSWEFPDGSIEFFGIGGPGEFTYEQGRVLSVSDLSPAEKEPLRIHEVRSPFGTHFSVSGRSGFSVSSSLSESGSRRVVSRWPHAVFRKTLKDSGMDVRVKEEMQIENMVCFHRPPQRSEIVFVPLSYEPGDIGKTVTIVAQRPREAEFVVHLPVTGHY